MYGQKGSNMTDTEAWEQYPHLRHWYNKLWLSKQFNYYCGPSEIAPTQSLYYIVRPIINLHGMGLNAELKYIEAHDNSSVPKDHFWCQMHFGPQYSIDLEYKDNNWEVINCYQAFRSRNAPLYRFGHWIRTYKQIFLPSLFDELIPVHKINVEVIGNKIIEAHLRTSPYPYYNEMIPIWSDHSINVDLMTSRYGYKLISTNTSYNQLLPISILGYLVK